MRSPGAQEAGATYLVARLFGVGKSKLAMVFLAPALGFPELFTLLVVAQVKHLLNIFLIFYLGEGERGGAEDKTTSCLPSDCSFRPVLGSRMT